MLGMQRILLAVACVLCVGLLNHFWARTPSSASTHWRLPERLVSSGKTSYDAGYATLPTSGNAAPSTSVPPSSTSLNCPRLAGSEDLVIILKTGATEIYEKLPIHLATTFACAPEYLVYSDLAQHFGPVHVRDALALVSKEMRDTHEDLAQYRTLQQHVTSGADAAELRGAESWRLDKWKFLPMVSDAYATYGRAKKWYVFVEADTYVSMHNLLLWLKQLESSKPVYAGAQVMIGDTEFAHGGSGFVMSSPAVQALTEVYKEQQTYWERKLADECCGDKLMAEVLLQADPPISLLKAFPLVQGETLTSLDWSPTHWCMPAVTWHHVDAAGIDKLWHFERSWHADQGADVPILFADYYEHFTHPRIAAANGTLDNWDNLSDSWTLDQKKIMSPAYANASACEAECRRREDCLQWSYRPGMCRGGEAVKLGWALDKRPALGSAEDKIQAVEGANGPDAVSGWLIGRIEQFRLEQGPCDRRRW